jgi:predicted transcriptional regulator
MRKNMNEELSRRERQIMDILYRRANATVAEVLEELPDPPSYSAVRALLRILEIKGHVKHRSEGPRYVYSPIVSREKAKRSALEHLLNTFFNGSTEKAVAMLIDVSKDHLSPQELDRLSRLIDDVKEEGR